MQCDDAKQGDGIWCRNDFEMRPAMRLLSVVCIAVVLSGCQNTRDRERCLSYGFIDGTPSFSRCLQRFDLDRDRRGDRPFDDERYEY